MPNGKDGHALEAQALGITEEAAVEPEATRDRAIDKLLEQVERPSVEHSRASHVSAHMPLVALRTGRVEAIEGRIVTLAWRGGSAAIEGAIAEDVDVALVRRAMERREPVLVEVASDAVPVVVGVVQTRLPEKVELRGETITIEAERELLLRSGRAAVRLREDGDLEIVGSRIAAMSRGLFRIVGRVLRLN
jgi:hypothetical protein